MTDKNNDQMTTETDKTDKIVNDSKDREIIKGVTVNRETGRLEFHDSFADFMESKPNPTGRYTSRNLGLDALHVKSDAEDFGFVEGREERRELRRRRQRHRRRIISLCTLAIALVVIGLFVAGQFSSAYNSESDFEKFADQQFRKMRILPDSSDRLVTYEYDDALSYAYRYDPSANEDLAVFRDQQVADLKKDFAKTLDKDKPVDRSGSLFHKDSRRAMLFDTAVYDTGNGALSMVIYSVEYNEQDGKMNPIQTSVQTYLLDPATLRVLNPMQLMTPDYKEKTAVFSQEYLNKNYDEEDFLDTADQYLKEADANYNQFILDDGEMTVFFDEGTVLDPSEGVVAVTIPKVYLGTSLRSQAIDRYIDPDKPMVAITYDDGPGLKSEKRILKCLRKYGAVATFFYLGNRVAYDKQNVRTAYEIGCEIGNHSWDHPDLTGLSAGSIKSQLKKTNNAVKKITGVSPEIFRPPYGSYNDSVLKAAGMPAILWSVDTLDWSSRDANAVFKVIKKTKKLDGKVILMHSIYDSTAKATEKIIPYLQKKGYQFVTVTELIKYRTGKAPKAGHTYD